MPTLIHLNGPSGVGKSTIAQRYAADHPGVLALDIDLVVPMIGGWREDFFATLAPARELALVMAAHHLSRGHDVVVPQLVTDVGEARQLEDAAAEVAAAYVEVALLADSSEQIRRFRAKSVGSGLTAAIADVIDEAGGDAVLLRINDHLRDYLGSRPAARRLVTDGADPEKTYAALRSLLEST